VDFYKIPIGLSLGVVAGILAISILASLWKARNALEELSTTSHPLPEKSAK
jgi:NhaP-type Na+/H+ or K+/H+ antiporter